MGQTEVLRICDRLRKVGRTAVALLGRAAQARFFLLSRSIERSVKPRKYSVVLLGHREMTGSKSKNRMPTPVEANAQTRAL